MKFYNFDKKSIMKNLGTLITILFFLVINYSAFSQCKADSAINYQIIGGQHEIGSIEHYWYDENDSLTSETIQEYQNSIPGISYHRNIKRKKVKGNLEVTTAFEVWTTRVTWSSYTQEIAIYRKGKLISQTYSDHKMLDNGSSENVNQAKNVYAYDKNGHLTEQIFSIWNVKDSQWKNQSKIATTFNENGLRDETITSEWDSTKNSWSNSWKNVFGYDSLNELSETITYQFMKGVWVPHSRTEYGIDPKDGLKFNVVQKWNGEKSKWVNEFYYIFQLNEEGKTKTEIHLSWTGKEWKIDLTYYYFYNENGEIYKIMNDNKQVIMERFCR